jgi:hypothetical protein
MLSRRVFPGKTVIFMVPEGLPKDYLTIVLLDTVGAISIGAYRNQERRYCDLDTRGFSTRVLLLHFGCLLNTHSTRKQPPRTS